MVDTQPYSVCLNSPVKVPNTNLTQLEQAIEATGLCVQYHLTNATPDIITKAEQANQEAMCQGRKILAVVRRTLFTSAAEDTVGLSRDLTIAEEGKDTLLLSKGDGLKRKRVERLDLLEANSRESLHSKISLVLKQLAEGQEQLRQFQLELHTFGSKKTVIMADLVTLEVSVLDWYVQSISEQGLLKEEKFIISHGKEGKTAFTFFEAWWFCLNELVVANEDRFNILIFWCTRFPDYMPTPIAVDLADQQDPNKYVIGTSESAQIARKLWGLILKAANSMVLQYKNNAANEGVGKGVEMSPDLLVNALGFFISVLRPERNESVHFWDNLIQWPKGVVDERRVKRQKRVTDTCTLQMNSIQSDAEKKNAPLIFPYDLNLKNVDKAINLLQAIQATQDNVDADWRPMQANIEWFSTALLKQCQEAADLSKARVKDRIASHNGRGKLPQMDMENCK